jgi:hypothetical protein
MTLSDYIRAWKLEPDCYDAQGNQIPIPENALKAECQESHVGKDITFVCSVEGVLFDGPYGSRFTPMKQLQ